MVSSLQHREGVCILPIFKATLYQAEHRLNDQIRTNQPPANEDRWDLRLLLKPPRKLQTAPRSLLSQLKVKLKVTNHILESKPLPLQIYNPRSPRHVSQVPRVTTDS
jgi:hypothetical protein